MRALTRPAFLRSEQIDPPPREGVAKDTEIRPAFVLSANARPGVGGQGQNLAQMLAAIGPLTSLAVYARASHPDFPTSIVPASFLPEMLGRFPVIRRRRDWGTLLNDLSFDRYVAKHLPVTRIVQGAVGQCAETLRAAKRAGARTILDVVNTHVDDFARHAASESARFGTRSFMHPMMQSRIHDEYRQADVMRVMSDASRRTFLDRGFAEDRVVTVHPAFDLNEFTPATFSGPRFRVIFVGLIEPWKGFHHLIEGFVRAAIPESELILWGGSGVRSISRYCAEIQQRHSNILFKPVSIRDLGYEKVYTTANVLVHPSLSDGFGYVVGEAMASALPVVVTSATGASDLVREGENGFVVPPADPDAIAERLKFLAKNSARAREMGMRARDAVAKLTMSRFSESYRSILGRLS